MPSTSKELDRLHRQFNIHALDQYLHCDVLSSGPVNAEIVIIGEGPGETEVRQKTPFVGGAGKLLWDSLRPYGLHRANVYVTNVVKRQISLSRKGNERHVVRRDELSKWIGMLQWELEQLPNARIVLAMGNYAIEAVAGLDKVTNWRGSVLDMELPNGQPSKIVITINPAYAQRELKLEPAFLMDIKKFDLVVRGVFKPHVIEEYINPDYKTAMKWLKSFQKHKGPISYDIETINNQTACHGFALEPTRGYCINLRDDFNNRYTVQEEADILLEMQKLFKLKQVIAQNGAFDAGWTGFKDYMDIKIWFDTMLAHHTLYPQFPHSLAFQVSQYTTHPFYKDEGKDWKEGGNVEQFWRYNCKDTALTYAVYQRELAALKREGLDKFFFEHVMALAPELVDATVQGILTDTTLKATVIAQVEEDLAKTKAEFHRLVHEATGEDDYFPNPGSWQQLQVLFFKKLGLQGRGTSTDAQNRIHIMKNPKTPAICRELINTLNIYATEAKFAGTYAKARTDEDNRMRCTWRQTGVQKAPGRLSSAETLWGTGQNLQNQPNRARRVFISDPGSVFIYFDLSQAEAQVVGYRANIQKWKEQFEYARTTGKYDCHRALASEMFKVEYDEVPRFDHWPLTEQEAAKYGIDFNPDKAGKPTIRYIAKRCRHGLNYRMEKFRLSEVTNLPYHVAAKAFTLYHTVTPELEPWWRQEEAMFKRTKTQYNAFGRRNKIIQRMDEEALKSVVAFYPQSTIGDKVGRVWRQCHADSQWPDASQARIRLNVHDCLVGVATPKVAKTALRIMKKYAEEPIMIQDAWNGKAEPLIIAAETKMSVEDETGLHRWSNLVDVEV